VSNSKRNWAIFGVGVKLIVILRHIIAYFSINIRWHSQTVSSESRKWLIKHLFPLSSCKKQINKHNFYLLLAFLQYGSVPELDMHESKHLLPGQFVHSGIVPHLYNKFQFFFIINNYKNAKVDINTNQLINNYKKQVPIIARIVLAVYTSSIPSSSLNMVATIQVKNHCNWRRENTQPIKTFLDFLMIN
jgi:hypothetical protein